MIKLVHIVLQLFIFCLDRVATQSWCHKPYIWRHMPLEKDISSNGSLLLDEDEALNSETWVNHHAVYQSRSYSTSVLYGAMATLDVYEFLDIKKGQTISTEIWIVNFKERHHDDVNVIQAGWVIDTSFYGDNKTHFSAGWTANGYKSMGCFDLKCDGFVPVNYAPITPGDTLEGQSKISIKIFKNEDDGDWWLHFARNGENFTPVGYWPKSLFNTLTDHADKIIWGGYTRSLVGDPSPPMGNRHWPGGNSATYQDVQYVNSKGQGYNSPPWPAGVYSTVTHKKCYQVSVFMTDKFYYGGPGGCTN